MKTLAISILLALAVVPASAGAVSLYGETNSKADVEVINVQVGATTTVETGSTGSTNVETPSGVTVGVERSGDGKAMVTIEHRSDNDADAAVLESGVQTVVRAHGNVRAVDLDADGAVDVAYVHKGFLFGFIPISITSQTVVSTDADGDTDVSVTLPWWKMFVSGLGGLETDTQSTLTTNTTIMTNAKANASAEARVRLVEAIVTSLAEVDAKIKASYDLKANTK